MSFKYQTEPVDESENVLGVFYGTRANGVASTWSPIADCC
jgi:hypothetical protein